MPAVNRRLFAEITGPYCRAGFLLRLYAVLKLMVCPFLRMEALVPRKGKILDLGCGIGFFSHILAACSHEREIDAIDIDDKKIATAEKVAAAGRIRFFTLPAGEFPGCGYDAIVISDMLYLLPRDQQETLLAKCGKRLAAGGMLLVKEIDTRPRWKYWFNYFEETLAVKVFKLTRGGDFFFRSSDEYSQLLRRLGFEVEIVKLHQGYLHSHIAYQGRKRSTSL